MKTWIDAQVDLSRFDAAPLIAFAACMDAPLVQVIFERRERVIGCGHVSGLCVR